MKQKKQTSECLIACLIALRHGAFDIFHMLCLEMGGDHKLSLSGGSRATEEGAELSSDIF